LSLEISATGNVNNASNRLMKQHTFAIIN